MTPDLPLGVFLEIIVCVFLAATIAYCAMLDRRLRAMRSGQDGLRDLVRELNVATQRAVTAIDGLKQASAATNDELGERVRTGRILADELTLMIEAGNSIAERLGHGDRPALPRAPSPSATFQPGNGPRSTPVPKPASGRDSATAARAAHQLLDALKRSR
ncbi:conserved hypothetical protein [Parvibaculum lavamentivorans DS-1]|uniref:DUF6468 domain-containing protein n=1 Tax=Parvibaculum lavamentivorans (strain DS-1 / DSM 13023 / NCIMB 13966) TaxID=402881 RepID=A7HW91_PARL1|nr:DUF6468 domain-containing protein [Parvibaculum lavamentivorans]ABS64174.1 conserved hypothetical protein [Parvibaculum lavamentivorans DS-1]